MSESDAASVECPLCGEQFDPTAAGGWCTNSDCGEWQYDGDRRADESGETDGDDGGETATDAVDDEPETEGEGDGQSDGTVGGTAATDDSGAEGGDAARGDAPDDGDPVDDGTAAAADEVPDEQRTAPGDTGDGTTAPTTGADTSGGPDEPVECPGCGSTLDADVNFCPDCGEDVSELPDENEAAFDACPACGADVDPEDSFCAACGEDLEVHRGSEELAACPDCGADVDADDTFCAECGADLDAHRSGDAGAAGDDDAGEGAAETASADDGVSAPDALALTAHDQSVVVTDGDAVGREIRSLLTDAGRPEDEAVRVHREHVRFVREDGQFYLVDLGENPTRLNGATLSEGDREPVGPGDELALSDVVTLTVEPA